MRQTASEPAAIPRLDARRLASDEWRALAAGAPGALLGGVAYGLAGREDGVAKGDGAAGQSSAPPLACVNAPLIGPSLPRVDAWLTGARLVEGRFPKYQDVVPREFRHSIELVAGPFHSAVRQSIIVTNEESRGVDFTFADGNLTLNSTGADIGTSRVEIPISYDGEPITITFDPKFIAEYLKVLEPSSALTLNLIDAASAAVFKTDGDYIYVVMPLARDDR